MHFLNHIPVQTTGLTITIPWADIVSAPYRFYQTSIFCFPIPLRSPDELSNIHVLLIAEFLGKVSASSSTTPFIFVVNPDAQDPLTLNAVPVIPVVPVPAIHPPLPPPPPPPPEKTTEEGAIDPPPPPKNNGRGRKGRGQMVYVFPPLRHS
jgi:hypothetical protein